MGAQTELKFIILYSLKKHKLPPQDEEESSGQGSWKFCSGAPALRVRVQGAAGLKLGHKQHSRVPSWMKAGGLLCIVAGAVPYIYVVQKEGKEKKKSPRNLELHGV